MRAERLRFFLTFGIAANVGGDGINYMGTFTADRIVSVL